MFRKHLSDFAAAIKAGQWLAALKALYELAKLVMEPPSGGIPDGASAAAVDRVTFNNPDEALAFADAQCSAPDEAAAGLFNVDWASWFSNALKLLERLGPIISILGGGK